MQKNLRNIIMLLLLSTTTVFTFAQENTTAGKGLPKWVSDKGYWVVVSNVKTPKTSEVFFYNNDHALVHSEKVHGTKLNLSNRRTCVRLNKILNNSLEAYALKQPNKQQLVTDNFGLN